MEKEVVDLLLVHALIVTQDDQRRIIPNGAIAIRDGKIIAVDSTFQLVPAYQASEVIDLTDQVVFPGLIDTHTHLFQVATKGLGEDMSVQDWVEAVTAPTAIHITPEEMYLFCLIGCLEHIHCGVTTLVDMSYMAHTFELHEENIRAIHDSGLRGRYTTIISDFGEEYGVLPQLIRPIDWFLDVYSRLQARYPDSDRMGIWMAIGAPWTISDDGLLRAMEYANRTGTRLVMHINENEVDNLLSQQRHGKNVIPFLDEVGFLRSDLLAVHCVVTNDEDIKLLVKNDVKISYNPVSNMYLGSGIAPVVKMQRAGLTIGLGVDGAGSNNSQDMIETMKVAALLQKVNDRDASVVNAQQVLDWATRDGAKALGLEKEIGSLEVGKRADLFAVAINTPKIVPIHDPVASLVYSCGEENVVLTIADGKVVMKDGIIQSFDEKKLIGDCQQAALGLANRCGSNRRLGRKWVSARNV
ncbi:MAG: amidohydrolase [Anaerolineales bacterium]